MIRIDLGFLLLGALCLIAGVSLGIAMGIAHDFQFAPIHAHMNLVGWASLAIFGLVYRAYPMLAQSRLGTAHFAVSAVAALVFLSGLYFAIVHQVIAPAVIGAILWLIGAVLFFINLIRLAVADVPVPAEARALRRASTCSGFRRSHRGTLSCELRDHPPQTISAGGHAPPECYSLTVAILRG